MKERFLPWKQALPLALVAILALSSCNLPTSGGTEVADQSAYITQTFAVVNTSVAETQVAIEEAALAMDTPEAPEETQEEAEPQSTSEPTDQNVSSPNAAPTATRQPLPPAPTAVTQNQNPKPTQAGSANTSLNISSVRSWPIDTVYYGNCAQPVSTLVAVEATITPLDQIQEVVLWYDIFDPGGVAYSGSTVMYKFGAGDYAGEINIAQIAPNAMGSSDGSVAFWLEAKNKSGASYYSSTYSVNIENCSGNNPGAPPAAPPVILSFTDNGPVQAGNWVELAWQTSDAVCGVTLDGNSVDPNGYYNYGTATGDAGKTYTHTLMAYGAPCDNPSQTSATVSVSITSAQSDPVFIYNTATLYHNQVWDLDNDGFEDISFEHSSGVWLSTYWGSVLSLWAGGSPNISQCTSQISGGSFNSSVSISTGDSICFMTDLGNYGHIYIDNMYLDLSNSSNSYINITYSTEVK